MKKVKSILIVFLLLTVFTKANAQVEKYQSLFIYNFSKYIKWPDNMNTGGNFVIGILGDSDVYTYLKEMADTKRQTQNMSIVVKKYNSAAEVGKCHILYVSDSFLSDVSALSTSAITQSTLIITNGPGMAKKGAVINFVQESGKIRFELNQAGAEQKGLKVAGSLASLSILV